VYDLRFGFAILNPMGCDPSIRWDG